MFTPAEHESLCLEIGLPIVYLLKIRNLIHILFKKLHSKVHWNPLLPDSINIY